MGILGAIQAFFSALGKALGFLKDRQLINAGKAEEQRDAMVAGEKRVAEATAARTDPTARERLRTRRFRD